MTGPGRRALLLAMTLALAACQRGSPPAVDSGTGVCADFAGLKTDPGLKTDLYTAPNTQDRFRAFVLEVFAHALGCEAGDPTLALSPQ